MVEWWGRARAKRNRSGAVCVCRQWRGSTNRLVAAVCRCRKRPNGEPPARRQSPFKPFPAQQEQLLYSLPAPRHYRPPNSTHTAPRSGYRSPGGGARQKSDISACYVHMRPTTIVPRESLRRLFDRVVDRSKPILVYKHILVYAPNDRLRFWISTHGPV